MRCCSGYSLLELIFAVWLGLVLTVIAIPSVLSSLDEQRTAGAIRYLTTRCAAARMEAAKRGRDVAVRFVQAPGGYDFAIFADGNGDGVRTRDIQLGIDVQLTAAQRLSALFAGVMVEVPSGLPGVDGGAATDGDPVKLGSGDLLTYSASGTSSSGSVYVRGRSGSQYVVKSLGETGRLRTLKFNAKLRRWDPA